MQASGVAQSNSSSYRLCLDIMAAETRTRRGEEAIEHTTDDSSYVEDSDQEDGNDAPNDAPLERLQSEPGEYANFSLRHGLQDADPNVLGALTKVGLFLLAGGAVMAFRRLLRRQRLDVANAWAWSSDDTAPATDQLNPAKPLMGTNLVVGEKCASHEVHAAGHSSVISSNSITTCHQRCRNRGKGTCLNLF